MASKRLYSETDIAKVAIRYLENLRWDVYQEVCGVGGRADIVAKQGPLIWVIEAKASLGLPVIEQAHNWLQHAHLVSVATPSFVGDFNLARTICKNFGIGILLMRPPKYPGAKDYGDDALELLRPRLNRKPIDVPKLYEEQKTYAEAGTNGGGYFTPFRRTCRAIEEAMRHETDGLSMKELVRRIDHHYASDSTARACLSRWIHNGVVPGVAATIERGKLIVRKTP